MRFTRNIIFIFVLACIEFFFVPLPFAFIGLFLWQQFVSENEAFILAFITGFLFDIVDIRVFGTTSLLLTIMLFVSSLYKRKYTTSNLFFLAIVTFIDVFILEYMYAKQISIFPSIASMLILVITVLLFSKSTKHYESWYRFS